MSLHQQQSLPVATSPEPLLAVLCKSVIGAAHQHAERGIEPANVREAFLRAGVSQVQFELFIESMVRSRLLVRGGEGRLLPTTRGLAYAGIRPESRCGSLLART